MAITRIGVIGAGTMGNGIAQTFARHGFQVTMVDTSAQALEKGLATIQASLAKLEKKALISPADITRTLSNIATDDSPSALAGCQLVVEAATESAAIKESLFRELDRTLPTDAILASNTSSISLTRIAAWVSHPERVIGMHFMNPVPLMPLVEIIRALQTDDATHQQVHTLAVEIGKTPVTVKDGPGFVSNRILMPMINEAAFALYENLASAEDIDTVMKLGMNHPMGPLTLADFIGLDVCVAILDVLHQGLGDPKYRACPL
ncbi:MAG: NAD(P)-binding domain-containing protein, partial [Pseudogulbenkiania sp.]|nr:NAD(P)-binding domain-containing protein [Pseudogulbenkiania sp.]